MILRKPTLLAAALWLAAISLTMSAATLPVAETTPAAAATATTPVAPQIAPSEAAPAVTAVAPQAAPTEAAPAVTAVAPQAAPTEAAPAVTAVAPQAASTGTAPASTAPSAEKMDPKARLAALIAAARASGKMPAIGSFDRYRVIITNNIFVRDRKGGYQEDVEKPASSQTDLSPEQATVLRGIVRQLEIPGAPYVAYLEDVRTGTMLRVRMGDPVCQGKLANPTLDSVDYVKDGVAKRIEVGKNMAGGDAPSAEPAEDKSVSPAGTGAASASTSQPASLNSIADQMRLKRLKDLAK